MAYASKNLSVLAYANGFTLWHYTTEDVKDVVMDEGYFNSAADMLRVGDIIVANMRTEGQPQAAQLLIQSNTSGVVGATDMVSPN